MCGLALSNCHMCDNRTPKTLVIENKACNNRPSKWDKVFKSENGQSKIYGRQPLKYLNGYGLLKDHILSNFLKALFHIFYLVYS